MSPQNPRIPTFTPIGPRTSLSTPVEKQNQSHLIILCTWLGAAPKHIAKYTAHYRQHVAPTARILLVEADVSSLTSSYASQKREARGAADVVLETLRYCEEVGEQPKILLHVLSNGGTNAATQLLEVVGKKRDGAPLPLQGILFDSCPAKGTYWKSYDAMKFSLPKGRSAKVLGGLLVHCILVALYTWIWAGNENPASLQRRTLLDEEVVEGVGMREVGIGNEVVETEGGGEAKGRACYLYSKADRMCHWEDVASHAEMARQKAWLVKEVVFEGSGHCAHLSKDEGRYIGAMEEMWERA